MDWCFFVACCILTPCLVSGETRNVLHGQMLNLKPPVTRHPDNILWKHDGNKAVEFNGQEEKVYGLYEGRITLDWVTAELNISNLRYEDSGLYELEIFLAGQLKEYTYKVEVMGKVSKPTISCQVNDSSSGTQARLMCSAESTPSQTQMRFKWESGENIQNGAELTIPLGDKHDDEIHICRVSNALTEETATFTAKDCNSGKGTAVAVGVGVTCGIIILLLAVCLGVYLCKQNKKAKKQGSSYPPEGVETATTDELGILLDRAPTLPSTQRLNHPPPEEKQPGKPPRGSVKYLISKIEGGDYGKQSPPDSQTGSEGEADENEEAKSPSANGISPPTDHPRSLSTQNSPDLGTEDTADEHEEDTKSDQDNAETTETTVRESDSTGPETRNKSGEENQPSAMPEQSSPEENHEQELNLSQEETLPREDVQEMDKTASEDESGPSTKEVDTELNLSQQPHSPAQTKPDNTETSTLQESLSTPLADPDQKAESKTEHDSDASEGQSDSNTAEAERDEGEAKIAENNEAQCGPEEEKNSIENGSEDKEGQGEAEQAFIQLDSLKRESESDYVNTAQQKANG